MENHKQHSKWAEYIINEEWELEKARIDNDIITKLSKTYPNVKFNNLEKMNDYCMTDDNCIHYKTKNNDIYSWNYTLGEWIQPNKTNQ